MKINLKSWSSLLLLVILFGCSSSNLKDGNYRIEIYATNDIHGRLFDSLYVIEEGGRATQPYSMASVATKMAQIRAGDNGENTILVDLGDHLQGDNSVYYYNFVDTTSTHIISEVFNYLQYDAVVVGNHDIEPGPAVYNRVKEELNMPYLAANAVNSATGKPYFPPYQVVERSGVKIAIIGMTNPNIPSWLAPELWSGLHFEEIITSLERWIEHVKRRERAHVVVVAMHAGVGESESYNLENPARYIAKNVEGIDLILAAHDHKVVVEKIAGGVLIVEGGSRAEMLSAAYLDIEVKDGEVKLVASEGEVISMEGIAADKDYNNTFRESYLTVKEYTNRVIGELSERVTSRESFFGPSRLVDFIHKLMLDESGAGISLVAPLSFNMNIEAGEVIFKDIFDIYPYENQLYVIEMSGEELRNYLEYSYSGWVDPEPLTSGHLLYFSSGERSGDRYILENPFYNFDSAAGVIYEVDITQKEGSRVTIISMDGGEPFELDSLYKVALTSYRASGGGGLLVEGANIAKEELNSRVIARHGDIRQLIAEKIEREKIFTPKRLYHWKFVPEELVSRLILGDMKTLYGE